MMPITAPPADVLTVAADYIERHGLYRGDFYPHSHTQSMTEGVPVCAAGALIGAYRGAGWTRAGCGPWLAESAAMRVLRGWIGTNEPLSWWSDAHTQAEVVQGIRAAAARARRTAVMDVIRARGAAQLGSTLPHAGISRSVSPCATPP